MDKITSRNNELIKGIKKLFTSRKARMQECKFVLEGARLCFDVFNSVYKVNTFLITESAAEKYKKQFEVEVYNGCSIYAVEHLGEIRYMPWWFSSYYFTNIEDCKKRIDRKEVGIYPSYMFG